MKMISSFLEQAVNLKMRFETLLTLLKIASEPDCRVVRYVMPPPDRFSLFIPTPKGAKDLDFEKWAHSMPQPETLSLNQLCEAAHVVMLKIHEWEDQAIKATERADKSDKRALRAEERAKEAEEIVERLTGYRSRYGDDYLP